MSTAAQHARGSAAMSRDIDARTVQRDPIIERLEASRDIAHGERDKALALVAELTAELQRARRCLAVARLSHEVSAQQWQQDREDMRYRLEFAARHIGTLRAKLESA